jgi:hypothetical protein
MQSLSNNFFDSVEIYAKESIMLLNSRSHLTLETFMLDVIENPKICFSKVIVFSLVLELIRELINRFVEQ